MRTALDHTPETPQRLQEPVYAAVSLTPLINSTCFDIDCYVVCVWTRPLSGQWCEGSAPLYYSWDQSRLLRLTVLTGAAAVHFDKVLISLSLTDSLTMSNSLSAPTSRIYASVEEPERETITASVNNGLH
ncbi:hypothetical protein WMY93_013380 [Mugilogobius chulae]|uniref:Uncharacterized protein n=1 Tax=Mugilogobius chulae TaxID=88201 RepID=A0AAW0P5W3_9GOBI